MKWIITAFVLLSSALLGACQIAQPVAAHDKELQPLPGAFNTGSYLPQLKGKRVAVFANHTATIGQVHLVDSLLHAGIEVVKIFGPEHGFRGTADAGEKVGNLVDQQTGIPIVSLYGSKRKPSAADLADVDVMLFDIQDVGVRFYTYISSLQDYMEAALEHGKPLIVLDRPNPNGFYIDGPVLDTAFRSFIGMQPIPVVYGMTMGEYAQFLVGERLLQPAAQKIADRHKANGHNFITVVPCINYNHNSRYILPQAPSPNLPNASAIYWYPSTCFFEGTVLSEGRGTDKPFQVFGHPSLPDSLYRFTPVSMPGAKSPKLLHQTCFGWNVSGPAHEVLQQVNGRLQLKWLLQAYRMFPEKDKFFIKGKAQPGPTDYFFNKLAGNALLMKQIELGFSETHIRQSWQPALEVFKQKRKKYLLYPDFY